MGAAQGGDALDAVFTVGATSATGYGISGNAVGQGGASIYIKATNSSTATIDVKVGSTSYTNLKNGDTFPVGSTTVTVSIPYRNCTSYTSAC